MYGTPCHGGAERLCVLLVDDNPADCDLVLEAAAQQDRPVQIEIAPDGPSALDWLHDRATHGTLPDVLLLDIRMPGMTGFEVLRAIRESPQLHHLPVVMLTTSSSPEDIERAYDLLTTGYLVKAPDYPGFAAQITGFVQRWSDVKTPGPRHFGHA